MEQTREGCFPGSLPTWSMHSEFLTQHISCSIFLIFQVKIFCEMRIENICEDKFTCPRVVSCNSL